MRQTILLVIITTFFSTTLNGQLYKWEKEALKNILRSNKQEYKATKIGEEIRFFGMYEEEEVLFEDGFGSQGAIEENSIFYAGKFIDVLIAIAILQLEEQGKLKLDDPIQKYFPVLNDGFQDIQIEHLLQHTSGIHDYLSRSEKTLDPYKPIDQQIDILNILAKKEYLYFPAGKLQQYSGSNFWLLGQILEKTTQQNLSDFIIDNILIPLDLKDSDISRFFGPTKTAIDNIPKHKRAFPLFQQETIGLYTSAVDLKKLGKALFKDNFFSEQIKTQLFQGAALNDGTKTNMGMANIQEVIINGQYTYHFPSFRSAPSCNFYYMPQSHIHFIFFNFPKLRSPKKIARMMSKIYGDAWLEELAEQSYDFTYIEEIKIFDGTYRNPENAKKREINFQYKPSTINCPSCNIEPIVIPNALVKINNRSDEILQADNKPLPNPALALTKNRFFLWNKNIELEFLPYGAGYKLNEYEFGVLTNTYLNGKPVKYTEKELSEFEGTYEDQDSTPLTFALKNKNLNLINTVDKRYLETKQLRSEIRDIFFSRAMKYHFIRDESGTITGVERNVKHKVQFFEKIQ